jgi:hypothetical protein
MSAPGTVVWFARHEFRLAWRDWLAMMTAGRRTRVRTLAIVLAMLALLMHAVAFALVSRLAEMAPDKTMLVFITGSMLMMWSLLLSHAMEQVARAFYARSDLELLLSSPAETRTVFSVRLGAIAVSVMTTAVLISAPFINVLAAQGGARWLIAYATVLAIGAAAAAIATILTAALFETIGPKQTRLIAQIVAAVIAAGFVIALQFAVIASTGTMSRLALLASEPIVAMAPDAGSMVWWPARAVLGDAGALAMVLGANFAAPRPPRCHIPSGRFEGLTSVGLISSTLRHRVFGSLHRACPDDLPSRFRLEYRRFLCERVDAFPRLCGRLLDDNEFGESGHKEGSRFLEFFVAYFRERLDDALDVLPCHVVRMLLSDFLNELRLRHQLGHVFSHFRIIP